MPMSDLNTTAQQIEAVRKDILALLQEMVDLSNANQLPHLPDPFIRSQQELEKNEYLILVAGEAKRGKSSFINALIGQTILPTDVDVATSQVFRIRYAE